MALGISIFSIHICVFSTKKSIGKTSRWIPRFKWKKTMKFQTGSTEYTAAEAVIGSVDESLRNIEAKFEAMSLGPASSGGYPSGS